VENLTTKRESHRKQRCLRYGSWNVDENKGVDGMSQSVGGEERDSGFRIRDRQDKSRLQLADVRWQVGQRLSRGIEFLMTGIGGWGQFRIMNSESNCLLLTAFEEPQGRRAGPALPLLTKQGLPNKAVKAK
jgi:hypothetical protein